MNPPAQHATYFIDTVSQILRTYGPEGDVCEAGRSFVAKANAGKPVYVIGKNTESEAVAKRWPVAGLIDDFAPKPSQWKGIPLVNMRDVPTEALVVNCATSISPVRTQAALKQNCAGNVVAISDLIRGQQAPLELPWFVAQQRQHMASHLQHWAALYARMADDESRRILLATVAFRLTADIQFMAGESVHIEDQYFEPFMQYSGEVFVDAGGFDGDTTEEFCKRYPDYRKVILFEPSPSNMAAARKRLAGLRDIQFEQLGLSNAPGTLSFDSEAGSASAVAAGTSATLQQIEVTTLDTHITESVSFIKMDLEGWELHALEGCAQHIRRSQPKLAIAVYHDAKDFIAVHDYVESLMPNCDIFLRHYTQGWSETVMFFKPRQTH